MSRYFSRLHDPIVMMSLAPGEEYLPRVAPIQPWQPQTLRKSAPLTLCTFTFDNTLFLTTVKKKKVLCILNFSKRVSDL